MTDRPILFSAPITDEGRIVARLRADIDKAHWEAWNGLARMKWSQFGYWAAAWVRDNRKVVGDDIRTIKSRPSPFRILAEIARAVRAELDAGYGIPKITFTVERRNIDALKEAA